MQHLFYLTLGQVMVKDCRMIPRSMSAERYLRKVGVPEDNIAPVVHTGVWTDVFRPMNKMDARIRFGLEEDRNVLLAIGQMKDREMMDRLFQALALLKVMNPDCLLIVRPPRSQAQLLQSMVSGMGLKDNVRIMAEGLDQADSVSLFNCADLFVISTYADYDALPAIEAISCGVPIATTYARGDGRYIERGAGAYYYRGRRHGRSCTMCWTTRWGWTRWEPGKGNCSSGVRFRAEWNASPISIQGTIGRSTPSRAEAMRVRTT